VFNKLTFFYLQTDGLNYDSNSLRV